MEQYRGVETTVVSVEDGRCELECDYCFWCEEMLEVIPNLKDRLKEFALVKFRTGEHAILIEGAIYTKEDLMNCDGFTIELSDFNSDLKDVYDIDNNIVAFSNFANKHNAITALLQNIPVKWDWEREEIRKMTIAEVLEVAQDVMECEIKIVEEIK
jgi:hypothetical protein